VNEPSPHELSALLYSDLPPNRAGLVIFHLLGPCDRCLSGGAGAPSPRPKSRVADLTAEEDAAYEAAIDRAFAVARRHAESARRRRSDTRRALKILVEGGLEALGRIPRGVSGISGLALFEALLTRSWDLRHDDPVQMVQYAWRATKTAKTLDVRRYGPERRADFECLAWAELGNANRVADKLDLAEAAFARAVQLYERGSGDKLLGIHLVDLQASLAADRRQFRRACQALTRVHEFHRGHGDSHLAGRALISKGLYAGYAGEPEEGIRLLQEGLGLLEEDREPGLEFAAVHNQLLFLADCSRFAEARKLLSRQRRRLREAGGRLNRLKVTWVEGRIAAGLGELARAEGVFRRVRRGLEEAGLGYQAALAALDLAAVLLHRSEAREAQELVEAAAATFVALGIEREAVGAILMLTKAFEMRRATVALVEGVTSFLRRAEHDPAARFGVPAGPA
jgi:tetratricopeptide (TPR) repeat protein